MSMGPKNGLVLGVTCFTKDSLFMTLYLDRVIGIARPCFYIGLYVVNWDVKNQIKQEKNRRIYNPRRRVI